MNTITPCLWFNFNAEEAISHYLSIFESGKILEISYYGDAVPELKGEVLVMRFELEGREFLALNGGPQFPFTEAISLSVECQSQDEVDRYWLKLSEGGSTGDCGWLKDKYGLSWQIVPRVLIPMLQDPDAAKANRVMQAMMKMNKLEIAELEDAYRDS